MQHYSSINAALWNSLKNRQKFNFFRRACLSTIGHEGHSVCLSSVYCHTPNVRFTRILIKYRQYSLKIFSKFSQNILKIFSKFSQNFLKIFSKFSQNFSKFSQNFFKISSKFSQNFFKMFTKFSQNFHLKRLSWNSLKMF